MITLGAERLTYSERMKSMKAKEFLATLFAEYIVQQKSEQVDYVALFPVAKRVCRKLKISVSTFEKYLNQVFPMCIRGSVPYGMAIEVDMTPRERASYNRRSFVNQLRIYDNSIDKDGYPAAIISMRESSK